MRELGRSCSIGIRTRCARAVQKDDGHAVWGSGTNGGGGERRCRYNSSVLLEM